MYLLGFDIGSSSVKVSLMDGENGNCLASEFSPKDEMKIEAKKEGWAEQHPDLWWEHLKYALNKVMLSANVSKDDIDAIGISYQMHGLVAIDKEGNVIRPSIIWCDSRAVEIGNNAFESIGREICLKNLLNSPGNFTASKLMWVKQNEPGTYDNIYKIMLPGDYIAFKLTGKIQTTVSGLSEGILWNFKKNKIASLLMDHYGFDKNLIPEIVPTFSNQGNLSEWAAKELGLSTKTRVTYRAGDQPNNAFSLNVLNPGEIAATAGTSGVVYGVSDQVKYDPKSRVNSFAHVNHTNKENRLGVLLCVNGTGILNSWTRKNVAGEMDYEAMNKAAERISIGSDGLIIMPFGNGAERMLGNQNMGASLSKINFNIHGKGHILRAVQEGIVFSFKYGIDIMNEIGITPRVIRAGKANMFLSPVFRETLTGVTGATIELYNTDGSLGAAKGAGIGSGFYKSIEEAFSTLKKPEIIEPDNSKIQLYKEAYENWYETLKQII